MRSRELHSSHASGISGGFLFEMECNYSDNFGVEYTIRAIANFFFKLTMLHEVVMEQRRPPTVHTFPSNYRSPLALGQALAEPGYLVHVIMTEFILTEAVTHYPSLSKESSKLLQTIHNYHNYNNCPRKPAQK